MGARKREREGPHLAYSRAPIRRRRTLPECCRPHISPFPLSLSLARSRKCTPSHKLSEGVGLEGRSAESLTPRRRRCPTSTQRASSPGSLGPEWVCRGGFSRASFDRRPSRHFRDEGSELRRRETPVFHPHSRAAHSISESRMRGKQVEKVRPVSRFDCDIRVKCGEKILPSRRRRA